ncbi:MAG: TonB-dependent receptor [Chlorobiaceae bacterium]|nr:TonB-dependent receptor [Chlorobiaceae bacterium]
MKQQQAMGSLLKRLVLSASFLTASLAPATMFGAEPGVLRGRVVDKTDGEGVVGASVSIPGTNVGTSTDINGNYVLRNVPASASKVTVSIIGYAPVSQQVKVAEGQSATMNFSLGQTTIMASEVVVGATLYKQDRLEVPVTVNVVSKDEIKKAPNPTLADAVENVPGVNVSRAGGNATSTLQIRGSSAFQGGAIGTRVQGTYDGFPINNPTTGEIAWTNINMNSADRVEVLKGAAATLYGSGAMGGVLNVYGSLPEKMEVKAGMSTGFYDKTPPSDQSTYRKSYTPWIWNTYAGFGNKDGQWNYSLLYSHSEDDGYKANTSTNVNDLKFKAKYTIDSRQYIQLTTFFNQTDGGYTTQWPFIAPANIYADLAHRFDATGPSRLDDTVARKNILAGLNYVNLLSDNLSIDTKVYYTRNESTINYNYSAAAQASLPFFYYPGIRFRFPGEFNKDIADRGGVGVKLDWKVNDQNRVLFGIDANVVDVRSTQYTANLPISSKSLNAYGPFSVPMAAALTDDCLQNAGEKNFAVFLQDEFKPTDKLTLLGSIRYDWSGINADTVTYRDYSSAPFSASFINPTATTAAITNKSVDAISPRLAANLKAAEDMSFRASVGKSFRAPTLAERFVRDAGLWPGNPNPGLDKETMTAYELGMFKQFGDRVSLDVAGFVNNYNNLIESRYFPVAVSTGYSVTDVFQQYYKYMNIQNARIWGIEANLNVKPTKEISTNFGYSYLNAKDLSDNSWLPGRPEHTVFAGVNLQATKAISCNANGRFMSRVRATKSVNAGDYGAYPGDFVVVDFGSKAKLTENVTATFNCKNVFNVMYSEAEGFPAAGRMFMAGVDLSY